MKIILLAALAFSQDSALRFEPAVTPERPALAEPGKAGAHAAPTEAGDISFNQGDGASLDFAENLAEEEALAAPKGRMLDEKELRRHALKGKLGGDFTEVNEAKRGLSTVKFTANRRVAGAEIQVPVQAPVYVPANGGGSATPSQAPQQAVAAPAPKRTGGHRIGRVGKRGGATLTQAPVTAAVTLPQVNPIAAPRGPSMLGHLMMSNINGIQQVHQGANRNQIWADGQELRDWEGNSATMTEFNGDRAEGSRHKWLVKGKAGDEYYDYSSPLVLDLDGNGVRMSRRSARFDADGDRKLDDVNDISDGDALLVFDADKDGLSGENALETFGNASDLDGDGKGDGHADGFEALLALARQEGMDADGRLDAAELRALAKSRGLALKRGGVLASPVSFKKSGVASIALPVTESKTVENFDGQGNKTTRRVGAVFTKLDGSKGAFEDVWFEFLGAGRNQFAGVR